ncbi:cysteine desulfurase family protein [Nocardioides sp. B-3]|uniref:cysteine desulfurase family protein n=1 Tax=Nocardioides sp. B-3 TaxID=2895565 RepID=UPI00300E2843
MPCWRAARRWNRCRRRSTGSRPRRRAGSRPSACCPRSHGHDRRPVPLGWTGYDHPHRAGRLPRPRRDDPHVAGRDRGTDLAPARVGNANSLHASGRHARRVVEESRETIARALGCRPGDVVFTAGGTESDNLALKGIYWARRAEDPRRVRLLTSAIEHHAVLDPLIWLGEAEGAEVELIPVDQQAHLRLDALRAAVERDPASVALISVMWANNEVGTLQPIAEVVALAAEHGIPVHTDAVQAIGAVPVDFAASGVDALSLTGHKVGGPYGVGALIVRRDLRVSALVHGGGQERDIRSGTLDPPAIAGLAAAVEASVKARDEHATRLRTLRDDLVRRVVEVVPDAHLHGDPDNRLPGNAHIGFPGCEGDSLLMLLDARGIECSTGSACSAGVPQPSHVLLAMGCDDDRARHSLRFSLGHTSTPADVDALVEAIGPVVERAGTAKAR